MLFAAVGNTPGTEIDLWFADKSAYITNLKQRLEFLITTAQLLNQNLYGADNSNLFLHLFSNLHCRLSQHSKQLYGSVEKHGKLRVVKHNIGKNLLSSE